MSRGRCTSAHWGAIRTSGVVRFRHRATPHDSKGRDERGATLILALIFIMVIGTISASVTRWATNDLNNTSKFGAALSLESAANSAVELALQSTRFNFQASTLNAAPQPCWTASSPPAAQQAFNNQTVSVWCSTAWNPLSSKTRVITYSACQSAFISTDTAATIATAGIACAESPLLQATVAFDDYPGTIGAANCIPGSSGAGFTCGTSLQILSWAFGVAPPVVTAVSKPANTCTLPSKLVSISGTLLNGATMVNFIPTASSNNVVISVAPASVSATTVTVCGTSAMTSGSNYQVTVTTPAGTSAVAAAASLLTSY